MGYAMDWDMFDVASGEFMVLAEVDLGGTTKAIGRSVVFTADAGDRVTAIDVALIED